jgi:hypothetical protein
MNIVLADGTGTNWAMGVTSALKIHMEPSAAPVSNLALLDTTGIIWQLGVTPIGRLTATPTLSPLSTPVSSAVVGASGYTIRISTLGTFSLLPNPWQPNGWGAGTDNSIVGGLGGFMAYPQPPFPVGVGPEANGQFGPLVFTYNSSTPQGQGNIFSINNPGRN